MLSHQIQNGGFRARKKWRRNYDFYIISIISIVLSLNLYLHFRVLVRHVDQNPNVVTLGGFGNNGVEELKEALEDDSVMYGLGKRAVKCACSLYIVNHDKPRDTS